MTFDHLSSHALTAKLGQLLAESRQTVVAFVLHLAELERRQLHLELGYSSVFSFCTGHLKLTKGTTHRRVTAARLVTRYPVITEYLADGRLCLTTLAELRDVLDDANYVQVLDRASGRTEAEVEKLVAALRPQPAPADLFRRLPASHAAAPAPTEQLTIAVTCEGEPLQVPAEPDQGKVASPVPSRRADAPRPINAEQYVLRVTVSQEFADDLEKVKALLSHSIPDGRLEAVLHACIRKTIAECEKRRRGSNTPKPRKVKTEPKGRTGPTEVKRKVWDRDGGTCAYLAPDGRRCGSNYQVDFHHLQPYARRGPWTAANIQLRCRAHNRYEADKDFGREFMQRAVRAKRGAQSPSPTPSGV